MACNGGANGWLGTWRFCRATMQMRLTRGIAVVRRVQVGGTRGCRRLYEVLGPSTGTCSVSDLGIVQVGLSGMLMLLVPWMLVVLVLYCTLLVLHLE